MKKLFLILPILFLYFSPCRGQHFAIGPVASIDWNLYHRYQRPQNHIFSTLSGGNNSAGQVLNVLPSTRIGIITEFDLKNTYFLLEGGVSYMPFSYDLEERKGQAALSFPVMISALFTLSETELSLSIGAGVQFSRIEFSKVEPLYQGVPNPFFRTYFIELGIGMGGFDGSQLLTQYSSFVRVGIGEQQALSLDIGIRGQIGMLFF